MIPVSRHAIPQLCWNEGRSEAIEWRNKLHHCFCLFHLQGMFSLVSLFPLASHWSLIWYNCSIELDVSFLCVTIASFCPFSCLISPPCVLHGLQQGSLLSFGFSGVLSMGSSEKTFWGRNQNSWGMCFACFLFLCWSTTDRVTALNAHLCFGCFSSCVSVLSF